MHDVAKTLVDVEIHLEDGREWRLWHGPIPAPYRVRYRPGREYHLHSAINPLLCERVLGGSVLDWMMTQPKLFSLFMYTISGHTERGGIIGELVHQADRASVAKALGGDPVRALSAPVESIQRKLAEGLRYMVKEHFKLNQKGGVAWLTDESLWLVSPRAINELKTHLYAQGIKSIPADLNRLYGELMAHGLIEEISEGKSVWKCEISEGDWKQSFNMIKVLPTLVWGMEDRPASFSGKLVIQEERAPDKEESEADMRALEKEAPQSDRQADQRNANLSSEKPAQPQTKAAGPTRGETIDEDIIALFPEVEAKQPSESKFKRLATLELQNAHTPTLVVSDKKEGARQKSGTQEINNNSDLGKRFWHWLKLGLADHSIVINDTKAPVHVVGGTYFLVSPGIFKRFSTEVLSNEDQWKLVQKRFQKLDMHIRTQGQNIHSVSVEGPSKTGLLKGYLVKDPYEVSQEIPPDNWVLTLLKTQSEKDHSDE